MFVVILLSTKDFEGQYQSPEPRMCVLNESNMDFEITMGTGRSTVFCGEIWSRGEKGGD